MRRRFVLAVGLLGCMLLSCAAVGAAEQDKFGISPQLKDGEKWRIAYYEGGENATYDSYLAATVAGLVKLGWLDTEALPTDESPTARALWSHLARDVDSKYLEFVEDAYYTAEWDNERRVAKAAEVIDRLSDRKDIDLVIAMGTWAGKDLANNSHDTPTVVMSSSDPLKSGIIKSIEDSGYDHILARVDPGRFERQVRIFHDIIGFKKLGVAYEDSVYGRSYAAIELIEKVAQERGFEIVRCFTKSDIADQQMAGDSVVSCFDKFASKVDAIYVTQQGGVNKQSLPQLVQITNKHRIPTFSQNGSTEVKSGLLMSISRAGGFRPVGLFLGATIGKIFNGAKPRELNQVFEEAPIIALNLKTAEIIGLYLYADVLAAADEIYHDIEGQ